MAALKEYHWDAKGNTYGNLLIRIGEDDYIGGDTFMDHGRACFSLQKNEAAVWTTYNEHGQLAGEQVRRSTQRALFTVVQSWWWRPCGLCRVSIARLTSTHRWVSSRRRHTSP